jgi:hypothetical protein
VIPSNYCCARFHASFRVRAIHMVGLDFKQFSFNLTTQGLQDCYSRRL